MNYELRKKNLHGQPHGFSSIFYFLFSIRSRRGFTIIEMIVSIALFSFAMLATTSVLLSVVDANRKAQGLKTTMNNLSLTLESMARNLRTGTEFTASGSSCGSGSFIRSTGVSFKDQLDVPVTYSLGSGVINIRKATGTNAPMTSQGVTIDKLCFYISGTGAGDHLQPKILIIVSGTVGGVAGQKIKTKSSFSIQTLVSQRISDIL